ncbi:trigger factor, partial [Patescibacteria group bacterium]|nr:trigger factor [Patescibacteria group bacterium]
MKIEKKILPKSQAELTIELSIDEMTPYLKATAEEISKVKPIKGFRPGKAPYEVVVKTFGEMFVYQNSANRAVEETYFAAIEKENIEPVDEPKIEILKLAPENPFIYKATISLLPEITLCDYSKISVNAPKEITVDDKETEKVLSDLQKMRAKETLTDKAVENGDKVEIDFNTYVDNVPIEGGQAKKHLLTVGEGNMIPGFEENLIGLKKDDEKEFELAFPKKYHEQSLANKKATFKIKVIAVYKIELPELNDDFAKGMGLQNIENLKKSISSNIKLEKQAKQTQKLDLEIIEKLLEKSE